MSAAPDVSQRSPILLSRQRGAERRLGWRSLGRSSGTSR